jgi:hypothetical protein
MAAGILLAALRAVLVFLLLVLLEGLAERVKDYYKSRKPPNDQLKAILKPEGTPTTHLIQARAIPNERLKRAFHLTNAFVSADSAIRRGFIEEASLIIKVRESFLWLVLALITMADPSPNRDGQGVHRLHCDSRWPFGT